jgi:hypothetical protein
VRSLMRAVINRTRLVWSAALAALVLLGVAAPGAWAVEIEKPTNLHNFRSHLGDEIEPVAIEGTELEEIKQSGLPSGLKLRKISPDKWEIVGTPLEEVSEVLVILTAENAAKETYAREISWQVGEPLPEFVEPFPGPQTSTVGTEIAPVIVKALHAALGVEVVNGAQSLPEGLKFGGVPGHEGEWQITGRPKTPTPEPVTVELVAQSTEHEDAHLRFKWTINAAPTTHETPPKLETPAKPPETPPPPPPTTIPSAGRLGTLPVQKPGKSLTASFLCEVASCQVQVTATITAGKKKFKIHSARTPVAQGQKAKLALKLSRAQQGLVAAALKKHKRVSAALAASISSSVGFQVTKALVIAVKR